MVSLTTAFWIAIHGLVVQSPLAEAERLRREGRNPQAIAVLEEFLRQEPENFDGGNLLAWLYAQTGEPEKAIECYYRLVHFYPNAADLHNSLGALLFRERRIEEARRELETARSLDPKLVMAHYNLGLLSFERGDLSASAESFERAVELDPKKPQYRFSLARAYRASYLFERAAEAFRAGLALDPPPSMARGARLELALSLRHQGLLFDAEAELRKLLSEDASDSDALFQLGRLYVAMNRYADAEGVFRRLVEASPDHAPAHFMLGFLAYRLDEPEKALESFQKLLSLSADHVEGHYYVGMILQKQGNSDGAREAFEKALRVDPEHPASNYNLALLLAKKGERDQSEERLRTFRELAERRERLESLEERVRWDPNNARFYFDLGQEYSRQKRTREALQAFQRALEIDPDLAAAEVAIANLLGSGTR